MDEVDRIREAYAGRADAEISAYDGAEHNFAMPYKPGYNEAACTASRAAVLACFKTM